VECQSSTKNLQIRKRDARKIEQNRHLRPIITTGKRPVVIMGLKFSDDKIK